MQRKSTPLTPETPDGQTLWRPCAGPDCHYLIQAPSTHCAKHGNSAVPPHSRVEDADTLRQQIQTLTRERDELLLDRLQPGRVSPCCHYRVFTLPTVDEDGHESPSCMQCARDAAQDRWQTAEAERDTLRQQLAEAQQALDVLWQWASEGRNHLDSDPVPDGLGQQVIAALQGVPDPVVNNDDRS